MFIFSIISIGVYRVKISGWFSNSSYSVLGSIRCIAQSISYEVCFFLIVLCLIYLICRINLFDFLLFQDFNIFLMIELPIFLMFIVSFLAELNRTPFDFTEGESELVSGFNIEYGGTGFAFIFLGEYLNIFFSSIIITLFFFGFNDLRFIFHSNYFDYYLQVF